MLNENLCVCCGERMAEKKCENCLSAWLNESSSNDLKQQFQLFRKGELFSYIHL